MEIYGLPQPLTGNELVTIPQTENGRTTIYTVPLSDLLNQINAAAPAWWVATLPTALPPKAGVLWNNTGSLAIS